MGGRPQFTLFGIPVRIEPFFPIILFVLALTAYQGSLILSFVAVAAISVLIHELGHALAYKHYGMQPRIVLHGWGGLTFGTGELSPGRSILVSLAGPVPPLVLFGLPALLFRSSAHLTGDADLLLWQIVWINVGWSLLNLLPILPLDGGNVVASSLELAVRGKGRMIANVLSLVVAGAIGVVAVLLFQPFFLIIALFFGFTNVMELTRRQPAASPTDSMVEAHRALLTGHPAHAEALAREGLQRSRSPEERRWGNELVAWSHLLAGDVQGAQQLVAAMGASQPASQSFYGSMALLAGRREEGLTLLTWAFVREPAGPAKSLAALVAARTGSVDALAHELTAMGGTEGPRAAELLHQLVAYAGYGPAATPAPAATATATLTTPTATTTASTTSVVPAAPSPTPPGPPVAADRFPSAPPNPTPSPTPRPDGTGAPPSAPPPPAPAPQHWPTQPPASPPSAWRRPD